MAAAVAASILMCGSAPASPVAVLGGESLPSAVIDQKVADLVVANHVKGLGVALIRDGKPAYLRAFGEAGEGRPLTPDTVMYGASLTKATFAYMVMQLVDEGRVDLDRPLVDYLPKPLPSYAKYADLAGDPRWRRLTFRILLDHTSGFANFRFMEPDHRLRLHRDPGARFGYSGEGINLAQFVLEQGLGLNVGREMQRRVFDRFGMSRTALTWRADFANDSADLYPGDGSALPHHHREEVRAAGSMDTTLRDWSAFLAGVVRGDGLSRRAKAEMIRLQIPIDSPAQFPTLTDEKTNAYGPIRLGYGLGWGVFDTPFGHAFFKEGHDDGTANYALCVEPRRACLLLLSNADRAEGVYKTLVEMLMGKVGLPWRWEGYSPVDQTAGQPPP